MKQTLLPIGYLFLFSTCVLGLPPEDPFLEAARKRETAVKVADITFNITEYYPKGSSALLKETARTGSKSELPLSRDLTLASTNRLVIQGRMTRFEGNHPLWYGERGEAVPNQVIRVANTNTSKAFYPNGQGIEKHPSGAIPNSPINTALQLYYLRPIGLAFRGQDRTLTSYPVSLFILSPHRHRIGERDCLEYLLKLGKTNTMSYYVDPQIDYNVLRIQHLKEGRVFTQLDIVYAVNNICGWAPESWVHHWYSEIGLLQRRTDVRVVTAKYNEPLAEDKFDIVFPTNTHVWHARDQKYYRVQEDGRLRLLSDSGNELSSVIAQSETFWSCRHLVLLTLCGLITVFGLLLLHRLRRSQIRS